jgi:nucleoside-diphosphate-sugar epimerase
LKNKILICGKNSLLYEVISQSIQFDYDLISHKEITKVNLSEYKLILCLSFNPNAHKNLLNINNSIEAVIANKIKTFDTHIIYISTSKIYQNHLSLPFKESSSIDDSKISIYAKNKLLAENFLISKLNNKCCILRLSNLLHTKNFGLNKKTFMSQFYKSMSEGYINMPINDFYKDFIDQDNFTKLLNYIISHYDKFHGIFNVGSGSYLNKNDFLNIATKFNFKIIISNKKTDSFLLDVNKINKIINFDIHSKHDVLVNKLNKYCKKNQFNIRYFKN